MAWATVSGRYPFQGLLRRYNRLRVLAVTIYEVNGEFFDFEILKSLKVDENTVNLTF